MIIPVRCVTCGKVLGDKWRFYERELDKAVSDGKDTHGLRGQIMDKLGLFRYCCRRHMLANVELVDKI